MRPGQYDSRLGGKPARSIPTRERKIEDTKKAIENLNFAIAQLIEEDADPAAIDEYRNSLDVEERRLERLERG